MDILDVAYVAIGAKRELEKAGDQHNGPQLEGELGYIQACIEHVGLLDRLWQEMNGEFPGVWCYEVAEPFWYVYGQHLLQGEDRGDAETILRDIVRDGMTCTASPPCGPTTQTT
jgi:hypothetical protein